MHRAVQLDRDGLLSDSRALAIIHEYLQTSGNAQHIQLLGFEQFVNNGTSLVS
jgi:hypothetical protein